MQVGSETREIRFPTVGGSSMRAAYATPGGEGPFPGVIMIHEIMGLNRDMREKAARLASMGYVTLAPDLYDKRAPRPICIARTVRTLGRGRGGALDDLESARAWLSERDEVDASRIGVIGFCMGGGFALLLAARAPLGAAAVFYGAVPKHPQDLEEPCPIVAGYGERDRIFAKQGRRLDAFLGDRGIAHDVVFYPDAGHSYMSQHRGVIAKLGSWGPMKVGFAPGPAEDSWDRVERFFGEHLAMGVT
jgi:carboxymethylenebutenolidase